MDKGDKKTCVLLFAAACILAAAGALCLGFWAVTSARHAGNAWNGAQQEAAEEASQADESTAGKPSKNSGKENTKNADAAGVSKLAEKYPDVAARIKIDGTRVDYPVMHSRSRKEDWYMAHAKDGSSDPGGSIYVRGSDRADFGQRFLCIYGHNMKDGSMFHGLLDLADGTARTVHVWETDASHTYTTVWAGETDSAVKDGSFAEQVLGDSFDDRAEYLALSTCTDGYDPGKRFIVLAVKTDEEEY